MATLSYARVRHSDLAPVYDRRMDVKPLVSVITPVRDRARFIETCLVSVLSQDYPNIEHFIVDGLSTDGTLEIIRKYAARYPDRIKYITESDKSSGDAWNKGMKLCHGEILGWLGADDTYKPHAVATAVEFFEKHPEAYFLHGGCDFIDEQGKVTGHAFNRDFDMHEALTDATFIATTSVFYKKRVVEVVGVTDTREIGVDTDFWIRIGKQFHIYRTDAVLSNFRFHKEGVTANGNRLYAREGYRVARRHGGGIFTLRGLRVLIYETRIFVWLLPLLAPLYRKWRNLK